MIVKLTVIFLMLFTVYLFMRGYQIVCCLEELNDRFTYFHDLLLEHFLLFAHVDNCVFYVYNVRMKLTAVKIFSKSQPVS
jgi:hypothetical protein